MQHRERQPARTLRSPRRLLAAIVLVGAPLACGACSEQAVATAEPNRALSAADFATPVDPAASPGPRPAETSPKRAAKSVTSEEALGGVRDAVVVVGQPSLPPPTTAALPSTLGAADPEARRAIAAAAIAEQPRTTAAPPVQVDQLVGQINGRPIYADEFFQPMDARFRKEAGRLGDREWLVMARKDIDGALWDKIRDDLLLAEFESSLTPEQRQGIVAFIETVRSDLVSGNLGSESIANARLREAEGLGLEQKVADLTQRRFILEQLRRAIGNRVQVSFPEVRLYYEQNIDRYSPPPVAKFRILRVPTADKEAIARVDEALKSGQTFPSIASKESTWRRDAGNGLDVPITAESYQSQRLFAPTLLNDAARALTPGEVTPRIDFDGDTYWIQLVSIERPPGRSLYEAQTEIENKLRTERQREEETRYFEQLFERGSFSDVKEMSRRLLEFAADRYLVQGRAASRAPGVRAATPEPRGNEPARP